MKKEEFLRKVEECLGEFNSIDNTQAARALDIINNAGPEPEEEDPCQTCERDDCYKILYGRCDRKK